MHSAERGKVGTGVNRWLYHRVGTANQCHAGVDCMQTALALSLLPGPSQSNCARAKVETEAPLVVESLGKRLKDMLCVLFSICSASCGIC